MSERLTLDLVLLVPGADEDAALGTLLSERRKSLRIRPIRFKILRHPLRDPGCFRTSPELLRPYQRTAAYALVIFDREGSGREGDAADRVARDLRDRLAATGWGDRAAVVVIDPELETWVWTDSPALDKTLGWEGRSPRLRAWLSEAGLWPEDSAKPPRPKEALQRVLLETRRRSTSVLFQDLARTLSLERCQDPAFQGLRHTLRSWFPAGRSAG